MPLNIRGLGDEAVRALAAGVDIAHAPEECYAVPCNSEEECSGCVFNSYMLGCIKSNLAVSCCGADRQDRRSVVFKRLPCL